MRRRRSGRRAKKIESILPLTTIAPHFCPPCEREHLELWEGLEELRKNLYLQQEEAWEQSEKEAKKNRKILHLEDEIFAL